jgi:conjugative transfer signal peptidase TraF
MSSTIRKRIVLWIFPAAVLFALVWHSLPLTFNWSPSVPVGVYWMTKDRTAPYLAFCMSSEVRSEAVRHGYEPIHGKCPDGTAWILKPNLRWAHVVTFTNRGFVVDDQELPNTAPLARDRLGRTLPHYPFGTYLVSSKEVWVVSSYNKRSYDSRYFGPISATSIVSYARPVLVAP